MSASTRELSAQLARVATLVLAAMPVLGMRPMVAVIAGWLGIVAWHFARHPRRPSPAQVRWTLLFGAGFGLMLLDLARADDLAEAWSLAERGAALLLMPLGFLVLRAPVDKHLRREALDVFSITALLLGGYGFGSLLLHGPAPGLEDQGWSAYGVRNGFAYHTGMHATYAAYFLFLGALFQLERGLSVTTGRTIRFGAGLLLAVLGLGLAARMPAFAFGVGVLVLLWTHLDRARAIRWTVLLAGALVAMVALISPVRERAMQVVRTPFVIPTAGAANSVNVRAGILHCTVDLLEEHALVGLGLPEVQPALDRCEEALSPVYRQEHYDTHCQPLHWWLAFGLPGLAAFLALFLVPLRLAWLERDGTYLVFLLFLLLCALTENLLARQWGVVLFAGMNALLFATRRKNVP